jgi:hypothetical protein
VRGWLSRREGRLRREGAAGAGQLVRAKQLRVLRGWRQLAARRQVGGAGRARVG